MSDFSYEPVPHDHEAFLKKASRRKGFRKAYDELEEEYTLIREMINARFKLGLTQEAVAERMGTTKSAVSRMEGLRKHIPSLSSLRKYAQAVGCRLEIRLIPQAHPMRRSVHTSKKRATG